jgi:hypothetical protein
MNLARTVLRRSVVVSLSVLASHVSAGQLKCPKLPQPTGPTIEVTATQANSLRSIVAGAASGTTILLADGVYRMNGGDGTHRLQFETPNVTLRSASGNRNAVILDGGYVTNELISIHASSTTIADLTLRRAYNHPIHISGPLDTPISGILLHNLNVIDPGQQAVKVNPLGTGTVDDSTLQCSFIQLTDAGREHIRDNCYTGGLDAHLATGWRVWRNWIEGFWCDEGLSEHGIHMWKLSQDTIVEENVVLDCARGIGFGLGSGVEGHVDGVIRNNFVAAGNPDLFNSTEGFDSGIALWGAEGAEVYNNTVASTTAPRASSIEWRYISTSVTLKNNLATDRLWARDGTSVRDSNLEYQPLSLFVDVANGDLHLVNPSSSPVDAGASLGTGVCDTDIDRQTRDANPDIGADEYGFFIFGDDFESADTTWWDQS